MKWRKKTKKYVLDEARRLRCRRMCARVCVCANSSPRYVLYGEYWISKRTRSLQLLLLYVSALHARSLQLCVTWYLPRNCAPKLGISWCACVRCICTERFERGEHDHHVLILMGGSAHCSHVNNQTATAVLFETFEACFERALLVFSNPFLVAWITMVEKKFGSSVDRNIKVIALVYNPLL